MCSYIHEQLATTLKTESKQIDDAIDHHDILVIIIIKFPLSL